MLKKSTTRNIIMLSMLLLMSQGANAQFKKYRSSTDFQDPQNDEIVPAGEDAPPPSFNAEEIADSDFVPVEEPIEETFPIDDEEPLAGDVPIPRNDGSRMRETPSLRRGNDRASRTGKSSSADYFGRKSTLPVPKQQDKYVNLNPDTAFGPEVVSSFDFQNVDLMELTKHMQKLTGINLILDKDLKGKISIVAPSPITVGDAWKAYLTSLDLNGYTLVKSGAFYKIINQRDLRNATIDIYSGSFTPETDTYIMRVQPLKNINATEISRNFRPFMSRYGRLIDIKQTNTLLMIDTGSNITRLLRMIQFLDVPGHEETLQIIKVKHSSAQEIAKLLDTILKSKSSGASSRLTRSQKSAEEINKIIAEPRTNSIIAMANADGAKRLRSLIDKLDVPLVDQAGGRIHVYYLNYSDAETLAKTLSGLTSGSSSSSKSSKNFSRSNTDLGELFTAQVKINADKDNNALVITASPTDYLTIKQVIAKLDVPKDQVYIEGLIMETNIANLDSRGTSIVGAYGSGAGEVAGFDGTGNIMNLLSGNITNLSGLFVGGSAGKSIEMTVGGQEVNISSINGLISLLVSNTKSNVLATPQLLVMDNTEGAFEVGETVPVPEKTTASNGSTSTSVKEQKVTLSLKITPQINKVTRFIKLKIDQKIDDFSNRDLGNIEGFGTTTRAAQTTVMVRDRDTIAMGGLMRDKETSTTSKVPFLGDIPVLGWLFKNKKKQTEKINLLFFLTPKILMTYEQTAAKHTQDILARRSVHLQNVMDENDPYASTIKGLYEKAKKQEEGPLYDKEAQNNRYLQNNQELEREAVPHKKVEESTPDVPDYQQIMKEIQDNSGA